ncbi:pilus assembly protein TadG-related protein [Catellatospora sp. NPDC049133]|uniref:pilus assembly protein TadG-related protein n=1 Tax=Catellatospora sp. NPDC049133 TaxID=3155499 RepID=UPI0033C084AF
MPLLNRPDRGAATTIVTILLAGGVLLGMTALVVDVGRLYVEREDLQSGADAAAMAVALDCARRNDPARDAECRAAAGTTSAYANSNAADGVSGYRYVCGSDSRLPTCTGTGQGNLTDCLGERPTDVSWAEVRTRTEVPGGSLILPPVFAQSLAGGYNGTTVEACARVGWGPPAGGFALTFSLCEYLDAVGAGDFVTGVPTAGDERVLHVHGHPDANPCNSGPSGSNLPGGFGWTDHDSSCLTTITGGTYGSDPGNGTPNDCKDDLTALIDARRAVGIPIFEYVTNNGNNGVYTLRGFAAFVVTGYRLAGMSPRDRESWLSGGSPCRGNDDCVYGYFTNAVVEWTGSFGTSSSLGATVVKTIG